MRYVSLGQLSNELDLSKPIVDRMYLKQCGFCEMYRRLNLTLFCHEKPIQVKCYDCRHGMNQNIETTSHSQALLRQEHLVSRNRQIYQYHYCYYYHYMNESVS